MFMSTISDMKSNNLGYSVPSTGLLPLVSEETLFDTEAFLATGNLFLLPCFSGKTRSAEQLWHVYENERGGKKTVSMLIICYIKGLSSSASC